MKRKETIEDVMRMAVRVSERMAKAGVLLHWSLRFEKAPPKNGKQPRR